MTQKARGVDYLHSLSHTKWNCRYHIVFAPKFRRKVFYEGRRLEIGKILSDLKQTERRRSGRGRSLSRPHPHSGGDTAEDVCLGIHGFSERQILSDDL